MARMLEQADEDADGWVYYMRINGRIKIGYTTNLRQRSRSYPPGTELLAVEPGTPELEKRRHDQFSRSLAQGREWFAESEALTVHIAKLAEQYATPTKAMHSYRTHEGIKHV
ncbi:GIY-YIG nuclease family protein [Microbacterium aurugineum]|uniref:GIY-YIG nuclease family protein n=1 Tax=Microbacterium aurugineum TaxID=2851642 RepID=UPI0020BED0B0|nr:GIY-YIG nuclease family protein [Microbacterium aurugineum]MCK8477215.1 GIY-YIG nuclease family protein [Microbacterium aurugineum]